MLYRTSTFRCDTYIFVLDILYLILLSNQHFLTGIVSNKKLSFKWVNFINLYGHHFYLFWTIFLKNYINYCSKLVLQFIVKLMCFAFMCCVCRTDVIYWLILTYALCSLDPEKSTRYFGVSILSFQYCYEYVNFLILLMSTYSVGTIDTFCSIMSPIFSVQFTFI